MNWTAVTFHCSSNQLQLQFLSFNKIWRTAKDWFEPVTNQWGMERNNPWFQLQNAPMMTQISQEMDEIWSKKSQMIVLLTLNKDMTISQWILHWFGSSRGWSDSGEAVEDNWTSCKPALADSGSNWSRTANWTAKNVVHQFFAATVPVWFEYLDLFGTSLVLVCLIRKVKTGLSRTFKH